MKCGYGVLMISFLWVSPLFGQTDSVKFDQITRRGIDYVYNLEFDNAEREFSELVRLQPRHPAGHFFLAMVQWWRILVDIENTQHDDDFLDALERVIDLCDEILDQEKDNVTALFFKGGALGFQGRLRFHRDSWLGAANAGRKALPLVQDASRFDPNNYDIFLGTGIYNYYAAVIPEQYPFTKPLLLFVPPGDRKKGIEQLTIAAENGKYASVEATYVLMQLNYLYEKNYSEALTLATRLNSRFPNNMLFHKYLGRCYVSLNNWPKVEEVYTEILARVHRGQPGYNALTEREGVYYLGLCEMNKGRFDSALKHFYRCDELSRTLDASEPSGFMVMANLKVGNIYDAQAKRDLAVVQYEKVLNLKEYKDSHKQAERFLNAPYFR